MNGAVAVILFGVAGCGKTSVGQALAQALGWSFFDADDFHPLENVAKMSHGSPLNDDDRLPWLENLYNLIAGKLASGQNLVLACSALKRSYRQRLSRGLESVEFVHLKGDYELIYQRLMQRQQHYMKPEMLHSQFAALEESPRNLVVSIDQDIESIVGEIIAALKLERKNSKT